MIGSTLRSFIAFGLALAGGTAATAASSPALRPDAPTTAPSALRTERIVDREALSVLGISRPTRLVYDDEGSLYVLDPTSRRVVKLDTEGRLLHDLGGYGNDEASLSLPCDLAIDRRQSLLVLDRGRGSIVAFDRYGQYLASRAFGHDVAAEAFAPGARILIDPVGGLWLLAEGERDLIPLDERLERSRRSRFLAPEDSLAAPSAAAFLPAGDLWVYDAGPRELRHFAASGRLLGSTGAIDSSAAAYAAVDLAADGAGGVYAADPEGQRILVFDRDGTPRLSRALGGAKSTWRPGAIAVSRLDWVAVADPERGEIQILSIVRESAP